MQALAMLLLASACGDSAPWIGIGAPSFGPDDATFEITIASGYEPGSLGVLFDGLPVPVAADVDRLLPGSVRITVEAGTGPHVIVVLADFRDGSESRSRAASRAFVTPRGAPPLARSSPASGDVVGAHDWLILSFADEVDPIAAATMRLACDGRPRAIELHRMATGELVVDPIVPLPGGAACELRWRGPGHVVALDFLVLDVRVVSVVPYDPADPDAVAPFPDDAFTEPDARSPTGLRVRLRAPARADVAEVFTALQSEVNGLDGWSPIAPIVLGLDAPLDVGSVPRDARDALDPLAAIALVDVTLGAPHYGRRIPFRLDARSETGADGSSSDAVLIFPSVALEPGHQYGLVVTRRARAIGGRPLAPSARMARALEPNAVSQETALVAPVLETLERHHRPPIRREDVALALRITVRSFAGLADDMLHVRERIRSLPPPEFRIDRVEVSPDPARPLAAAVHGTWQAPDFRAGSRFARDAGGRPALTGVSEVPFTLALPRIVGTRGAPIVIYQHGNPGSAAREVPSPARDYLLEAGFAVLGFTDILNREIAPRHADNPRAAVSTQVLTLLVSILLEGRVPDYWAQTTADQLAFLRLVPELAKVDFLPLGAEDGVPEIDPGWGLTYVGVSEGANHGPALLAYAPEIAAAVLVAGGARLGELFIHQESETLLRSLPILVPGARPLDVWVGLALFQTALDRQDAHNHARYVYRQPLPLGGDGRRASVLVVAGIDDRLVPNHATGSLAWLLGPMAQQAPVARMLPFLPLASGPLRGNVDRRTTAGYVQVVPTGIPGIAPTPGCTPPAIAPELAGEGHFCAQLSRESRAQRAKFLVSALAGATPVIEPIGYDQESP